MKLFHAKIVVKRSADPAKPSSPATLDWADISAKPVIWDPKYSPIIYDSYDSDLRAPAPGVPPSGISWWRTPWTGDMPTLPPKKPVNKEPAKKRPATRRVRKKARSNRGDKRAE
ncbi:MAG TPA: hypothetical protein VM537_06575 [Anaerolineae bacterium]|nr:hypothetical protein [Anaerolineae bacterium]